MNEKNPLLTPGLPETLTNWRARSLRDYREAGPPAVSAELTAPSSVRMARVVVNRGQVCRPMPGTPPEDTAHSHNPAPNESHYPTAWRVAQ